MTDIPKQCKALFDQLMRNEITQEEFDRQINLLKQPVKTKLDWTSEEA